MTNRLIHEQSPYLLQHAENPVNWHSWGSEAHTAAKELNRPIFLSIGYAACHWCHVMEKECFTDEEVARLLNTHFISIKVDREERPEIDRIYMTACQMMTGSGGWPLSIFLTPDLKPFYAATFIPKNSGRGMPGMMDLIPYLAGVWQERREEVYKAGDAVLEAILGTGHRSGDQHEPDSLIPDEIMVQAYRTLTGQYDPVHGGFGKSPKFPSIPFIHFLLQYSFTYQEPKASAMAINTMSAIAHRGIRDQIGSGFHRYATDNSWNIPHFEKMLYDQAVNATAFLNCWQISGDRRLRDAGVDCLRYICTTLRQPCGGFASAQDADSQGGEGAFYLWTTSELKSILTQDEYRHAERLFGITDLGNISGEAGVPRGSNIILRNHGLKGTPDQESETQFQELRKKLFAIREHRPHPLMDDKILTDWNGLAIEALAAASLITDETWMLQRAEEAARFILTTLMTPDHHLLHRWRDGHAGITGTSSDYIFFTSGLVRLFQASGNPDYLSQAIRLTSIASALFGDEKRGGFYATRKDEPGIPVRLRDDMDGPYPSVNGHAYQLLRDLATITGSPEYATQAEALISGMSETCTRSPTGTISLLTGLCGDRGIMKAVITGDPSDMRREKLMQELTRSYRPGLVIIPVCPQYADSIRSLIPESGYYLTRPDPAVYLCAGSICRPPAENPEQLAGLMDEIRRS